MFSTLPKPQHRLIYSEICLRILLVGGLISLFEWSAQASEPGEFIASDHDFGDSTEASQLLASEKGNGSDLYAEPIAPATHRRFPHLRPFEGHVLLGTGDIQLVIAGVPTQASSFSWQPGILAFFERREGIWSRVEAARSIDWQRLDEAEKPFYAVGLDLGVDRAAGTAVVTMVYASSETKADQHEISYHLGAGGLEFWVSFGEEAPKAPLPIPAVPAKKKATHGAAAETSAPSYLSAKNAWWMRLTSGQSRALPQLTDTGAASYLLRYRDEDVFAMLSRGGFSRVESPTEMILRPLSVGDVELLIGQKATLQLPKRLAAWESCNATDAAKSAKAASEICFKKALQSDDIGAIQVDFAESPLRAQEVSMSLGQLKIPKQSQPIFLFDASGQAVAYFTSGAGKQLIEVPSKQSYAIGNTAGGRIWKSLPAFKLSAHERREVKIPAQQFGTISLKSRDGKPALLVIRDADGRSAAGSFGKDASAAIHLADGLFRVEKWPFSLPIAVGTYEVFWFDPPATVSCRQLVNVRLERTIFVSCAKLPAMRAERTLELMIQRDDQKPVIETLQQVAPLTLLTPEVKTLRSVDPQSGLVLSWLGADAESAALWPAREKRALNRGETLLGRFAAFAREQSANGDQAFLELGCPPEGLDLEDYASFAKKIFPDAFQLFGCPTLGTGERVAQLIASLQKGANKGLLLMASSVWQSTAQGIAPAFTVLTTQSEPLNVLNSLRQGSVGVSAGATVTKVQLHAAAKAAQKSKKLAANSGKMMADLHVFLTLQPSISPASLTVYSETGWSVAVPLPPTAASDVQSGLTRQVQATIALPAEAEWVRFEVSGHSHWMPSYRPLKGQDLGRDAVLAATGFMRISGLLAQ